MPRPQPPGPDSSNNVLSTPLPEWPRSETSLTELADRFATHVPDPALSADLALQIVLNEIAEQACINTGATGAAIALEREGELVCRASSGTTAPELGAPLNTSHGLSGECVRTRQVQVCDDIEEDPRADPTATRQLGARSVIMLPLLRGAEVVGVMEAFSTNSRAFGEQDRRTLDVLGQRVLHNVEIAAEWRPARLGTSSGGNGETPLRPEEKVIRPSAPDPSTWSGLSNYATSSHPQRSGFTTYAFCILVLLLAIGLWVRIFDRLGWLRADDGSQTELAGRNTSVAAPGSAGTSGRVSDQSSGSPGNSPSSSIEAKSPAPTPPASKARTLPPGSLAVYDKGKEVFRMVPGEPATPKEPGNLTSPSSVEQAVSIEPEASSKNGSAVSSADLVRRVEPQYPEEALRQRIQGPVVLEVRAARDGSVQHVELISGDDLLVPAAIAAVKQWQFKPLMVNGHATEMEARVTVEFKLPQ